MCTGQTHMLLLFMLKRCDMCLNEAQREPLSFCQLDYSIAMPVGYCRSEDMSESVC